jgi:hypothetical protein
MWNYKSEKEKPIKDSTGDNISIDFKCIKRITPNVQNKFDRGDLKVKGQSGYKSRTS